MVSEESDRTTSRVMAGGRSGTALFVPDLALLIAGVTLFYCLFLFEGYQKLFRDSDAGWHIRYGEAILATGALPRRDIYSFSRAGQPWFAWEWLADIAAGAADRAAGLSGVAFWYAVAIAGGFWLWFHLHWMTGGNFLIAGMMSPLAVTTTSLHWLARPHVLGWLCLVVWVLWMERLGHSGDARGRAVGAAFGLRRCACMALLCALWANLHASFFLAPAIASIYAFSAALRPIVWNPALPPENAERPRRYLIAALIAAIAPLANPYGWRLYGHVFGYLTDRALLDHVGEFQSFNFHSDGAGQIAAALLIGIAGGVLALAHRRLEHFAIAMLFSAMAFGAARALPLFALIVLPLANGAITESLVRAGNLAPRLRRALDGFLTYSARLAAIDRRCSGWVTVPFVLAACFGLLRTPAIRAATGFSPREFPVAAYPHLRPGGRLFAPDKFGGYLIWRSAGARKVFFDGRSDFYGAAFLAEYARMAQARPGWRRDWDSWGFTDALVPADSPLVPALEQCGWRLVYSDPTAVILVGQASRPVTGGEFKAPLPDGRSSDPVRGDRAGAATVRERPWTGQEACPTVRSEWIVKKKS
ncbi:MAG: hypothetical protein ABSH56_16710 [Bryobacteraceae bacterium]|jgi:hypothetical protein